VYREVKWGKWYKLQQAQRGKERETVPTDISVPTDSSMLLVGVNSTYNLSFYHGVPLIR
jgi:hypothetical protein